jgi:hypothetical protein
MVAAVLNVFPGFFHVKWNSGGEKGGGVITWYVIGEEGGKPRSVDLDLGCGMWIETQLARCIYAGKYWVRFGLINPLMLS